MSLPYALLVAIAAVALIVWYLRLRAGSRARDGALSEASRPGSGPAGAAPPDLRGLVLRREFLAGVEPAPDGRPRAVVMDWSLDSGAVTLVAFDDGTTSLYMTAGGGVIGAGAHESVRRAADAFRAEAERVREQFASSSVGTGFPFPPANAATFYIVTDSSTLQAGPIPVQSLSGGTHPLAALGNHAQRVISAIREIAP